MRHPLYLHYTPPPEKEKSSITWGSGTSSKVIAAPRKGKIFHLVGLLDWNKLFSAPRKRKIFHLVGLLG